MVQVQNKKTGITMIHWCCQQAILWYFYIHYGTESLPYPYHIFTWYFKECHHITMVHVHNLKKKYFIHQLQSVTNSVLLYGIWYILMESMVNSCHVFTDVVLIMSLQTWFGRSVTRRSPTLWRSWMWWRRSAWRSRSSETTSIWSSSSSLQPSRTALWPLW